MNKTKIEWALNPDGTPGYTWNPITGCLNGCDYCYARKLANTRLKERYLANDIIGETAPRTSRLRESFANPFHPRFWEDRFYEQSMFGKPKGIFVCDMSDLFGIGIPEEWTRKILTRIKMSSENHRFYLLTKQPQNLPQWNPFPDNCWVGVSATNHLQAKKGMKALKDIQTKIKFMSFEPLLADMGFNDTRWAIANQVIKTLDWVIIGAQTKPTVYPKIEWVREIVEACDKAGIPVFLKQNLLPLMKPVYEQAGCISNFFTGVVSDDDIPDLRQEMPSD